MDSSTVYDALALFVFGLLLALIGNHLRNEYRRLFVDSGRVVEPTGPGAPFAAYLGYFASFFFAAALLFFASGTYTLVEELWRKFVH